jgi:hypothetical protein
MFLKKNMDIHTGIKLLSIILIKHKTKNLTTLRFNRQKQLIENTI